MFKMNQDCGQANYVQGKIFPGWFREGESLNFSLMA